MGQQPLSSGLGLIPSSLHASTVPNASLTLTGHLASKSSRASVGDEPVSVAVTFRVLQTSGIPCLGGGHGDRQESQ